jgi:hypothetical protein
MWPVSARTHTGRCGLLHAFFAAAGRAADAGLDADAGTVTYVSSPLFTADVRFGGQLQRRRELHRQHQTRASVRGQPDLNSTWPGSLLSAAQAGPGDAKQGRFPITSSSQSPVPSRSGRLQGRRSLPHTTAARDLYMDSSGHYHAFVVSQA